LQSLSGCNWIRFDGVHISIFYTAVTVFQLSVNYCSTMENMRIKVFLFEDGGP